MDQRVLTFKKKTRLTVLNMYSKLLNRHSVYPPFQKGGLGRTSTFRGGFLGKREWLYSGGGGAVFT